MKRGRFFISSLSIRSNVADGSFYTSLFRWSFWSVLFSSKQGFVLIGSFYLMRIPLHEAMISLQSSIYPLQDADFRPGLQSAHM